MTAKRNRRAGVEDRWTKTVRDADGNTQTVPSAARRQGKALARTVCRRAGWGTCEGIRAEGRRAGVAGRPDRGDCLGHPCRATRRAADRGAMV